MRALRYDSFGGPVELVDVPAPEPGPADVVVAVTATGVCRSDWHGWQGHDSDITLPQIPGHELAGVVVAVGRDVRGWRGGERVTVPFVCACGSCAVCRSGNAQVCPNQRQPGFTDPGSFAEQVLIPFADTNLVALPDGISDVAAAAWDAASRRPGGRSPCTATCIPVTWCSSSASVASGWLRRRSRAPPARG